jgi:dihydroneopterin aldolase/2-amino-4-hydroxy-6-hydroxymethyldihydropteridine diphosphokinase
MHKRDFVLIPLAQIAPYLRHPILHQTVEELLKNL